MPEPITSGIFDESSATPWAPTGRHHSRARNSGHLRQLEVLAYPAWRRTVQGWTEAIPRFRQVGQDWIADEMVHTVRVRTAGSTNGQIVLDHPYETHAGLPSARDHLQTWQFTEVGLMDSRRAFTPFAAMTATEKPPIQVDDRRLRWTDYFPGIDLDVVIAEDLVSTIFTIKDHGRALLLGHEAPNTVLAFRNRHGRAQLNHEWTNRAGQALDVASAAGTITREAVCLRSDGRIKAAIRRGWLRHEADSPFRRPRLRVERDLVIRTTAGQAELFEVVPWDFIREAPPGNLILNATQTYQEGVDGYSGCQEVGLESIDPNTVFSTATDQIVGSAGSPWTGDIIHALIRFNDIATLGTITAVTLTLERQDSFNDGATATYNVNDMLRNWGEGQATWNSYSTGNAWTTPGATGAGTDIGDSFWSDSPFNHASDPYVITFNPAGITKVNDHWQGANNNGVLLWGETSNPNIGWGHMHGTEDHGTPAERPLLTITYTSNSPPNQPTCYVDGYGTDHAILRSSAFADPDQGDTHKHSDWEIRLQSDSSLVASSYDDATHKTGITLSGLTANTAYKARVRHTDQDDADSDWSDYVEFTTAAEDAASAYPKWVFKASDGEHYYLIPDGKLA